MVVLANLGFQLATEIRAPEPEQRVIHGISKELVGEVHRIWEWMHPVNTAQKPSAGSGGGADPDLMEIYDNAVAALGGTSNAGSKETGKTGGRSAQLAALSVVSDKKKLDMVRRCMGYRNDRTLVRPGTHYSHLSVSVQDSRVIFDLIVARVTE